MNQAVSYYWTARLGYGQWAFPAYMLGILCLGVGRICLYAGGWAIVYGCEGQGMALGWAAIGAGMGLGAILMARGYRDSP